MTTQTKTLSFVIHGDALVERARDRVIESSWEHGLQILVEGLHGMTYEIAIDILRGKYTLTGNSRDDNVMLADQDQSDENFLRYKETFDFQFAGVYKDERGRILRPYAVVDSYGEKDFRSNLRYESIAPGSDFFQSRPVRFHDTLGKDPINWNYRALFYADDPHGDVVKKLKVEGYHPTTGIGGMAVLFEVIHDYPKLLAPNVTTDAQEALEKALAAKRGLSKRGYVHSFGENYPDAQWHAVTSTAIDNLPPQWVVENPLYVEPEPVKVLADFKDAAKDQPIDSVSAMNRMIVKEVNAGTSMSTAIALARAKMALMGGMAEDPEERISAINAHLAAEAERAEGKSNETYRKAIQEQAAGDYFALVYTGNDGQEVTLKVPTAPFEKWCLWRTAGAHLAKPWKRVTYSGLKCFGDDPYHTDWVIGAGLEPEDWPHRSDDPLHKAAWDKRFEIAQAKMGGNLVVLLGTGFVTGKIKHLKPGETLERGQIGVIRNAGPDYVQAAVSAIDNNTALITENGGNVAHLVTEFRDKPLRLVRIADARKIFKDGMEVDLDLDKAWRRIYEGSRGPAPGDLYLPPEWEIQDDA